MPAGLAKRGIVLGIQSLLWVSFVALDLALGVVYYPIKWIFQSRYRCAVRSRQASADDNGSDAAEPVKTVVIVGASFAGLTALRQFADNPSFRVVLIDQRAYFEYTPGVLRLFCDPSIFDTMARDSPRGTHEFVVGQVTRTCADHVMVKRPGAEDLERVDFDYLLLATGSDYRQPITPAASEVTRVDRRRTWDAAAARVRGAASVIILGGGAVGTELAAEIVCHFPDKRVTIVDGQQHLVPLFPRDTCRHTEKWFRDHGVDLVLGQMLQGWDETSCTLKSGRVLEADTVFVCFGMRSNSQSVAGGDVSGSLDQRGYVRSNAHFQVEGHDNIFAVGDVVSHPSREIKQAYYAEMNGKAAAINVLRAAAGQPLLTYPDDLAGAPVMPLVYVVSLGRFDGSLGFNWLVINGALAAVVKWVLEWTKVKQMEGRPIGLAVWAFGDWVSFLLSRTLLRLSLIHI